MVSAGTSDLVGSLLADRYLIVAPIGVGASARVYLADDSVLKRRVAVKVLLEALSADQKFLRRFTAEAQAAAALNHPNVMHVYDSGSASVAGSLPIPFLVLEFVGGGSLRAVLDQGSLLSPSQALMIGLDAARGLDYAHRNGFVHRDIKPANLLFGEEGRLRIADFGLARALAEASWTEPEGVVLGTARYSSPEQAMARTVDGRSDVYSLALVLVEAVTGVVPFSQDTPSATLLSRCEGDLVVPPELGRLAPVLEWAGRRDPELRPDAGELEIAFLAAAEDMDRPRPLKLPGAIPLEVLDARVALGGIDDAPTQIDVPLDDASGTDEAPASIERVDTIRRRWPKIVAAMLIVACLGGGAAYWWFAIRTPIHTVPNLVGMPIKDATEQLRRVGLVVDTTLTRKDGTSPDEVVHQDPKKGTTLGEGRHVSLEVSLGNTLITMPALNSDMDEATANAVITGASLVVGARSEVNDEKVPAGHLISSKAPAADATGSLPKQSKVDVVISTGPAPRTIPAGLAGQLLDAVRSQLVGVQLRVNEIQVYDETVPEGTVIKINHTDGEQVPRDTVIDVTVSQGPAPVPIPAVIGKTGIEATTILRDAGFAVTGIEGSPTNSVLATDPPVGEPHQKGTSVRIFTRR